MTTIKDALAYVLKHYPNNMRHELSNARVTKMLYLADWHQAINHGKQITDISWFFDNYGPYVNDVKSTAESNPDVFSVTSTNNMYGQPKIMISLTENNYEAIIPEIERASFDHVIHETQKMYWDSFIKLVYSTYPITSSDRYSTLDLVEKAAEYKKQKSN